MPMKPCVIVVAALVASGSTSYSTQEPIDLVSAVRVAAIQAAEGRRVDLEAGEAAPFAGVLLDDVALELLRLEVGSLRDEITALRSALEAQNEATQTAVFRAEIWKAEATPSAWERFARYACAASFGLAAGVAVAK